jgi:beta-lactamase class A
MKLVVMNRGFRSFLASIIALWIAAGIEGIHSSVAVAPVTRINPRLAGVNLTYQSLQELYQIRDRLRQQIRHHPPTLTASAVGGFTKPPAHLQTLQLVEIRIQIEETAKERLDRATVLAERATALKALPNPSLKTLEQIHLLWTNAIKVLKAVPEPTLISETIHKRIQTYQPFLAAAAYQYDTARSKPLKDIATHTNLPISEVFITVCNLSGSCLRWQGNQQPANPASLIKVPIAVALMQKVTSENINLATQITVDMGNYTEDASDIWAGNVYSLRQLLTSMLSESSNIATNQLIDYLGRDYINQILQSRGYTSTSVTYKMVGDSTYPTDAGSIPNRITTDDLAEMMRQIYNRQHPGDEVLMEVLASQHDTDIGYKALKNSQALWIGEKTGQNSRIIGTTLAFLVGKNRYVASVILNNTGDEFVLRQCINEIINYIVRRGLL